MQTLVLSPSDLSLAIHSLLQGEPVVFPTETVYGLGAPLFDVGCVSKIFTIKNRPSDNPLIAHISHLEQANELAIELPAEFFLLAKTYWPGPLTLVVKRKETVPALISAGHTSIAIRMPAHPVATQLIEAVGPMVAPSANLSGKPSPTSLIDVLEDLSGKVAYVIDGGPCSVGLESTVLSLLSDTPTLLRPGQITQAMLENTLKRPIALPDTNGPILSPGMKYRHYAPKAKLELITDRDKLKEPYFTPTAQTLYSILRNIDRMGLASCQIHCNETVQNNAALMNRLLRAACQS